MRILHPSLLDAQRQSAVKPAIMISVGDITFKMSSTGSSATCHNTNAISPTWTKDEGGRILKVKALESPYKAKADITLNNYDKLLFDLDLKGERLYISWGARTEEGDLYSTSPVLRVKNQVFYEAQGVMQCQLTCIGIMDLLGMDQASATYTDDGTTALGDLIEAILKSTLSCFDHCRAYNVIKDDGLDDLWTGVYLGPTFKIEKGETRAHALARLFDMTHASMRPGSEPADENDKDTIHIFSPSTTVQSEYTLDMSGHRFYVDSDSSSMISPNEIIIKTPTGYSPAYTGIARDAVSYASNKCSRTYLVAGLISNNQAQTIANTMLANIINSGSGSSAFVPMNCGTDIFDRMKITSKRSGRTLEGCVGSITRIFDPVAKEPRYDMQVAFGQWFDPRWADDSLGYGYGFVSAEDEPISSGGGSSLWLSTEYYSLSGYTVTVTNASAATNGAYITFKVVAASGTYVFCAALATGSNYGSVDIYFDDVKVKTQDCYTSGANDYVLARVSITVTTNGTHTIKILTNGKNASSSGYAVATNFFSFVDASLVHAVA